MIAIDRKGYFITGSDTDVGKTYIACEILRQLRRHGVEVETRKPAESGCALDEHNQPLGYDAAALRLANENRETIDKIAAYRFRAALAPHRAARLEGRKINLEQLVDACALDDASHCLIVEGAGGFYSPIAENGLNADLAGELRLSVIIVVNDRIGAVNQALLTLQAVESRQLHVAAIILNQVAAEADAQMDNSADLRACCSYPVFQCQHGAKLQNLFED